MTVQEEPIILTQELPGRISAFRVAEVRPQVNGIIQTRFFEEGADVQAGQVLYQIDPALYQTAYNNAKANLARAKATEETARLLAERYTELARSNAISLQERDDAIAAHKQNKAEIEAHKEALATAAINLGYTQIVAPVSGRIGHSFVSEGALVTQNQAQALAKIQQISPMYVDVTQSSNELLKLKRAQASGAL
ncbi:MAG: efflux RND transporter periplasmic adaptor subunit, partial [Desulfovibrionales bacterium]|nr:efflux RND transporter periplasmic adaptor subunit [Desulfovibrionales bacterium]